MLDPRSPGLAVWLAAALICLSTLAGAWLARRKARQVTGWLAVASALMLVTALIDMLPDAWRGAAEKGVPLWAVGLAIVSGFLVITYFTRKGCGHERTGPTGGNHAPGLHRRVKEVLSAAVFSGVGTAAALSVHRAVEGATLALTTSAVVVIALMVHSISEGLALTTLLNMTSRRLAPWLVVACVSPAAGILIATISPLPPRVEPILIGVVAGVLLRTALVGLKLAAIRQADGRLPRRHAVSAIGVAGTVAVLIAAAQVLPGGGEHPIAGQMMIRLPQPVPTPTPTATPFSPVSREHLRAAVATGYLSLSEVFARTDDLTRGTHIGWLLRTLPGHRPDDVKKLLAADDIPPDRRLGDLSDRHRAYLLEVISTPRKAR
ncbi:hypothetical protein Aple_035140 [Acrocarpospora pleiomorpha]|uniref:Zinc transporter ZupT n=2 Tax=Acrocarpospora pleiomorpha TaxID=90975 RepID=A0A5M3XQP2_9ACTN|nr:hypothetical protein Aple_035140 [Acrocarpospora pleiomorpha]